MDYTRLAQFEATISADSKIVLGVGTLFAATLMGIPATVYIAKFDSDNQISKLQTRVEVLEVSIRFIQSSYIFLNLELFECDKSNILSLEELACSLFSKLY